MSKSVWALKAIAVVGIAGVSIGLALLNIWGAWNASGENQFYTFAILGAEIYVAVVFPLLLMAPGWPRKIIGGIVFIALVYVCVENGKVGVKTALADIFTESADVLRQQVDLKQEEVQAAKLLASEYRRQSAEQQKATIDLYKSKVVTAAQPVSEKADELDRKAVEQEARAFAAQQDIIRLTATADKVEDREWWLYILLIGLEGARSFGLWAFILWDQKAKASAKEATSIIIDGKEYDPEWLARAAEHREAFEQGVKKTAETKDRKARKSSLQKLITDDDFINEFVEDIYSMRAEGLNITEMAKRRGQTRAELMNVLERCFTRAEIEGMEKGASNAEGDADSQSAGQVV